MPHEIQIIISALGGIIGTWLACVNFYRARLIEAETKGREKAETIAELQRLDRHEKANHAIALEYVQRLEDQIEVLKKKG